MALGKLNIYLQKNDIWPNLTPLTKKLTRIKGLSIRFKPLKFLEEKNGESSWHYISAMLSWIWYQNHNIKAKINKWGYIKLNFCSRKDTVNKWKKASYGMKRKKLQIPLMSISCFYSNLISNSYNSTAK